MISPEPQYWGATESFFFQVSLKYVVPEPDTLQLKTRLTGVVEIHWWVRVLAMLVEFETWNHWNPC